MLHPTPSGSSKLFVILYKPEHIDLLEDFLTH